MINNSSRLRTSADTIKSDYGSALANCDWDDDVAKVLKGKIWEISSTAYFAVLNSVGPASVSPVESGEVNSYDMSKTREVETEVDGIVSKLMDAENYLRNFKV